MSEQASVYINPLTDFGFKYIFGRDADKEFILSFLNALIGKENPITTVEFVDKEKKGESKEDRALIYDLHCKTADGRKIIVEMQNRYQTNFDDRALYYLSADIYGQGQKGIEWNYELTPVYGVFLMNFEWRGTEDQLLREDICLFNMQRKEVFSDRLGMTFIKIPMMDKEADDCKDTLERWIYLLKNMEKMDTMPASFINEPVFRRLGEVARFGALNEEERAAYKRSLKTYRDNYAIAETERAEGRIEGIAEGIIKGREEGRAEGEMNKALEIARAAKSMGMGIDQIMQLTKLSRQDIEKL